MSAENSPNGQHDPQMHDPGVSEAERAALEAMMAQAVADGVAFCMPLMPVASRETPEKYEKCRLVVEQNVMKALHDAPNLEPVLADILDPARRAQYPQLSVIIMGAKHTDGVPDFSVPKVEYSRISTLKVLPDADPRISVQQIYGLAAVLGFLTYPPLRALLGSHGLDCVFQQTKPAPVNEPSKLIV